MYSSNENLTENLTFSYTIQKMLKCFAYKKHFQNVFFLPVCSCILYAATQAATFAKNLVFPLKNGSKHDRIKQIQRQSWAMNGFYNSS